MRELAGHCFVALVAVANWLDQAPPLVISWPTQLTPLLVILLLLLLLIRLLIKLAMMLSMLRHLRRLQVCRIRSWHSAIALRIDRCWLMVVATKKLGRKRGFNKYHSVRAHANPLADNRAPKTYVTSNSIRSDPSSHRITTQ
jgi:hypothetical protein